MGKIDSTSRLAENGGIILRSLLICLSLFALTSPVFAASGISIAKTVSTSGYQTGSPGVISNFKIVVTNSGDGTLNPVTLTDLMPSGITYTGASPGPSSWSINSNGTTTITWSLGSMNTGTSKTIYPRGSRNGLAFGPLSNIAKVTGVDASSKAVTSQSTCVVTAFNPSLKVVESVTPSSGPVCADVAFTININNTGNDTFSTIKAIDLLPSGLSYAAYGTSNPPDQITNYANGTTNLTWKDLGYLGLGSFKTISFKARLIGQSYGQLKDRIVVSAKPPRDFASYVYNESSTEISALRSGIDVSNAASQMSGAPGTDIGFSINVTNAGEVPLSLANLTDVLPQGLAYVSSNPLASQIGRSVQWANLGSIAPGSSLPVRLTARIDGSAFGTLENKIIATGKPASGCNVTDEASIEVTAYRADIQIISEPYPASGIVGNEIDFKIGVTNAGEIDLHGLKIVDILPKGLSYSSSSIDPTVKRFFANGTSQVFWNNILTSPLAPGASITLAFTAQLDGNKTGPLRNNITVIACPLSGYNITVDEGTVVTAHKSGIQVTEAPVPSSGGPETPVEFCLNLTNVGDVNLDAIKLVDLLPNGLDYSSASITPNSQQANPNGSRSIIWSNILSAPLAPGSSTSVDLRVKIAGTVFGDLQNTITAIGKSQMGNDVEDAASSTVKALEPKISVSMNSSPNIGLAGTNITFSINITNSNDIKLSQINIVDSLPDGLSYIPTQPIGSQQGNTVTWSNLELDSGKASHTRLVAKIDGTAFGELTNCIDVSGITSTGYRVSSRNSAIVKALEPTISVWMNSSPSRGPAGTYIAFNIDVTNPNSFKLSQIDIVDSLPDGLGYISSQPAGSQQGNAVTWSDLELDSGETFHARLVARIDGSRLGDLVNSLAVFGISSTGYKILNSNSSNVNAVASSLSVNKTASKKIVNRGDEIDYIIEISNPGDFPVEDIIVRDVFDSGVEFISASPMPDASGTWHFDVISPYSTVNIALRVRVPITQIVFKADQKISGEGFVNVAQDYSTTLEQYSLNNQVLVSAKGVQSFAKECVIVSSEPGTELKSREHGSGSYSYEETAHLCTKNRSVEISKILAARSHPTTFALPRNRLTNFSSQWSELTSAKNRITNTTTTESYSLASRVNHSSALKLDENGTDMDVSAYIDGIAHLGFLKISTDSTSDHQSPSFSLSEDYAGNFTILEHLDEYGEEVQFNRSAAGSGKLDADKHIRSSQRTYESGSGDYQIEERIDTLTSFIAKDLELSNRPIKYKYSSDMSINSSRMWKEGMWSKSQNSGYIGEEFEDQKRLKKKTIAAGLNQIETTASFSGRSRFEAASENAVKLAGEQAGNFSLARKLLLKGVSRYDRPHITLSNNGRIKSQRIKGQNVTVAEYEIWVLNDGNVALEPVYIRDLLPPGTKYIGSSNRPTRISDDMVNWTLTRLGIGNTATITLRLNVTEEAQGRNLINRVQVCAPMDGEYVCTSNISTLEFNWLACCSPEIYMSKTASVDPSRPSVVKYTITLENRANYTLTGEITDHLPDGMIFLNSSLAPSGQSLNAVQWKVMDLPAGESWSIIYWAEASRNGKFINLAHADAWFIGGEGSASSEAIAEVVIDGVPEKEKKSKTDSSCMRTNCTNEHASVYDWNLEPLADCAGPCPAFSGSSEEEIP